MTIEQETIQFLLFIAMGIVFSIVFDFFRAIRKIRHPKRYIVLIQDIIYFNIITIILIISIVNIKEEIFRLYLIFAIILGIILYVLIIGYKIRNIFIYVIKYTKHVIEFVFLPVSIQVVLWTSICKKVKKYVKLCCKKNRDMIEFYHKKVKFGGHKGKGNKILKKEES